MSESLGTDRFLITGACGFLGSALVARLVEEGAPVLAFDQPGAPFDRLSSKVEILAADLRDPASYRAEVLGFSPTRVIHLAALIDNSRDFDLYSKLFETNLSGTVALTSVVRELSRLGSLVHASTGEEYGNVEGVRHEELPPRPVSPYSASKAAVTAFLTSLHQMSGFPATTARIFLPYGPGASPRFFVTQLVSAIRRGDPFPMTPGLQKRDFLYVDDVVEGLLVTCRCPPLCGEVVNICSGMGVSLLSLAEAGVKVAREEGVLQDGFEIQAGKLPYRQAEIMNYVGDPGKLERATGWRTEISIETGLRRMFRAPKPGSSTQNSV